MAIVDAINKVTGGHGATIEDAIKNFSGGSSSGGVMAINAASETVTDPDSGDIYIELTLDKTWQEIHDAFVSGLACIIHDVRYPNPDDPSYTDIYDYAVVQVYSDPALCTLSCGGDGLRFDCETASDYPVTTTN